MAGGIPAHDYLLLRLQALVDDAMAHGIAREVAVAVLIDLITSPPFDKAQPDPLDDMPSAPGWERGPDSIVLAAGHSAEAPHAIGKQDQADFVRPIRPLYPS